MRNKDLPMLGITMNEAESFSPDYRSARVKIMAAALAAGGTHRAYLNPQKGPHGEELAADAFWFGPANASNLLLLVSATHGVEGFCGSGAQMDWLTTGGADQLGPDTAALIVHALNPYGFAWLRRVTEEGVDLNRNGLDFTAPLPENLGYLEMADAFVPHMLDAETLASADVRIADYRRLHGERAFETARSCGQYTNPEGVFYGGLAPTWSRLTLEQIARDYHFASRRHVALIDYHTGLGPFGYGEPICGHRPGEIGQQRCRIWYGESLGEPLLGKSSSLPIAGLSQYAWARAAGEGLTFIALEFGTFEAETGARALRDDHWLHAHGEVRWDSAETQAIKAALRRFYHPDTPDWRQSVLLRSRQIIAQALQGMQQG
jgi:hypothetical protein